jgi:hypothetical protein
VTASELQFMLQNLGIQVRDELINDLINEASHSGEAGYWLDPLACSNSELERFTNLEGLLEHRTGLAYTVEHIHDLSSICNHSPSA